MDRADLVVTNMHANFTGVSATAGAVVRLQQHDFRMQLAGHPLLGCPEPISARAAIRLARDGPATRPFQIWHVRRNVEMQAALFVRDIKRLPIRIVFTSAAQRRHSAWPRFLIRRMDAVIAASARAANHVGNVHAVLPHGVDLGVYHPANNRQNAWADTGYPGTRGIACIGRIRPEKGTERFVDASIQALAHLPDVSALIIGRAKREHRSYLRKLENKVADAGLKNRILFVGEVPTENLPGLVRSLSLLVALPRYEGYGMTPLEAMASGVPIIATDTGHFRDFVGQDQAGAILGSDDPDEAANMIQTILSDAALYDRFATCSVKRATDHYDLKYEVAGIAAVYERLWHEFG